MIKKNKGLFILIGILVVLLAAYFGLQAWNKSQEDKAEQEDEGYQKQQADEDDGHAPPHRFFGDAPAVERNIFPAANDRPQVQKHRAEGGGFYAAAAGSRAGPDEHEQNAEDDGAVR